MRNFPPSIVRRRCLKGVLVAVTIVTFPALARAQAKATKKAAQYVDHPVDGKACGNCRFFIWPGASAPGQGRMGPGGGGMMGQGAGGMMGSGRGGMMQSGTCTVVEGDISPNAYCALYVAAQK